ncbi:MAG: flagellar basal body rod protein FlgB [Bacteriovoracaceae bacterium]|nr:flagellar basal body rod protein FlgB [Bacteriovoracaceae bacterium]
MKIEDLTIKTLTTALNMRQMRQELISANIANAETPGYKAKRIDFEEALARAIDLDKLQSMRTDDSEHFGVGGGSFKNLKPEIYEDTNGMVTENGNNVDRDKELALMAENEIMLSAAVQLLNKKLGILKYSVSAER